MYTHRKILPLILLALITTSITGCKQETCTVSCNGGQIWYVAVGYTRDELNGTIITIYPENNSFNKPLNTHTVASSYWFHPSADTTSDTLIAGAFDLSYGINNDVKLDIPGTNQTYKISNLKIMGNTTEQLPCHEGGHIGGNPVGPGCTITPYLQSYVINGTTVTVPQTSKPNDTAGYIYIHK